MKTGLKIASAFAAAVVLGVGGLSLLFMTNRRPVTQTQPQPAEVETPTQPQPVTSEEGPQPQVNKRPPKNTRAHDHWRREQAAKILKDVQEQTQEQQWQLQREKQLREEDIKRFQEEMANNEKYKKIGEENARKFRKIVRENEREHQRQMRRSRPPSYWQR